MTTITKVRAFDIRFPTSRFLDGSDAMNPDPDYSAAYCILETNSALEGHGLTFTLGRGTDLGRHLTRALATEDALDLMRAQSAFDEFPAELRQTIAGAVRERMRRNREEEAEDMPPPSNIVRLKPRSAEAPHSA